MNSANQTDERKTLSSFSKKIFVIVIVILLCILSIVLFDLSDLTVSRIPFDHTMNLFKALKYTPTTITLTTVTSTTTSSSTSTTTTTTETSTTSVTTTNLDEVLCDNRTDLDIIDNSENPCERIRCAVVLRFRNGRLGNRMFMFASAYGLARTHNCRLHISQTILNELSDNFQMKSIPSNMWLPKDESYRLKDVIEQYSVCTFTRELFTLNVFKALELIGYWQSYLYFDAYREEIREFFSARSDTLNRLAEYFATVTRSHCLSCASLPNSTYREFRQAFRTYYNITWISIHIRRGDFQGLGWISDTSYIRRAMSYFRRRHSQSRVRFLVASDDKNYSKVLLHNDQKAGKVFILPDTFSAADDLMALSLCHHAIVTGGTYGFWAAYLAGGDVIHDIRYKPRCSRADYYPPWFMLVGPFINKQA